MVDVVVADVLQYGTVRYGTVRYGTVRYGTVRYGTARHGTARHGTARHGTARHGTARHSTAQHSTALVTDRFAYLLTTKPVQRSFEDVSTVDEKPVDVFNCVLRAQKPCCGLLVLHPSEIAANCRNIAN